MKKDNRLKSAWDDGVRKAKFWLIGAATLVSTTCAFGQKNYNDKCNGSPAWLSSTIETRGSNNPAATISDDGKYYGMNQLDMNNVKRLAKFINSNNKYQEIKNKIQFNQDGSIKNASWVDLAKKHQGIFTEAQEDFICQIYLPECFHRLQKSLITDAKLADKDAILVSEINPAILSVFAHDYVKSPYSKKPFTALKKAGDIEKINSEEFIKNYLNNAYLLDKTLLTFHDDSIAWKDAQLLALCGKAQNEANMHLDQTNSITTNRNEEIAAVRKKISPVVNDKIAVKMVPYSPVAKVAESASSEEMNIKMSMDSYIRKNGGRM